MNKEIGGVGQTQEETSVFFTELNIVALWGVHFAIVFTFVHYYNFIYLSFNALLFGGSKRVLGSIM